MDQQDEPLVEQSFPEGGSVNEHLELNDGDESELIVSEPRSQDPSEPRNKNAQDGLHSEYNSFFQRKLYLYCKFISKFPLTAFCITLSGHLILLITTVILLCVHYDIFPVYFKNIPMELYDVPYKIRADAWAGRKSYEKDNTLFLWSEYFERNLPFEYLNINLYYETESGNIFTKSNLNRIRQIESELISHKSFKQYCAVVDSSLTCRKPKSILRFFDGTFANFNPLFNDTEYDNVAAVLYEAYRNNATREDFEYVLPKYFTLSPNDVYASLIRSKIEISVPTPKDMISWDIPGKATKKFILEEMKPKLWNLVGNVKEFKFYFLCLTIMFDDLELQTYKDLYFAIGSMCFIFFFMLFHTRSLWITSWAVFSIFTSYLGTNLIYRCIIGYRYFGYFQVMVIFIILGIGADDLFVFYDTWRLTSHTEYKNLAQRLLDCYSKSMLSMFITSLTTAVAFFVSAMSPLLATRSFGIFSGILVLFNYMSVLVFFPCVVAVHHLKFRECDCCCFPLNIVHKLLTRKERNGQHREFINITATCLSDVSPADNNSDDGTIETRGDNTLQLPKEVKKDGLCNTDDKLVVFFRDYYFFFITDTYVRWTFLVLFFTVVLFFTYQASRLVPDNEQLQFFRDSHNYAKARSLEHYQFLRKDPLSYVTLYIVWGLKENDRSTCDFTSIDCKGRSVFDNNFDPNRPKHQIALKKFCNDILHMSEEEISRLRVRKHSISKKIEIACFTHNLENFFEEKALQFGIKNVDFGLPWDYNKTKSFMEALPVFYPVTFNSSYKFYLDIPVQFWMLNANTLSYSKDNQLFYELIGEQRTEFSQELLNSKLYYYGNKLKFLAVEVNTTVDIYETTFADGIPVVENWENFISSKMDEMPDGLRDGFQVTRFEWHWFYVQKALANNAIWGITLGVLLAFPIITLSTKNIIIGFFATISICCTTVCVVGVIPFAGWKLGVLVSLNLCLVVGMSVDYVVHLAEGYHLSPHKDRISRTRDMLESMGSPVISGAFTTLGASAFMFFAQIQFALQFGVFIFCNIGFSLLFSLGFFTTFMGIFGPEKDNGSLRSVYIWCRNCFQNFRSH